MFRRSALALFLQILIAVFCPADAAATPPSRILFIGNSYTSVNNLPDIFRQLVAGENLPIPTIAASTPGGLTLEKHAKLPATLGKIDEGNWDVVIVQGQSQEAAMAEQSENMRANFQSGAAELCRRIKARSPNARIVFYQTWARHADYWNSTNPDKSVGNDPVDMQARIRKWYRQVAQTAGPQNAAVASVGDAWELNYKSPGPIRLHAKDNSHPAFSGSYLAAVVIYGAIYHPPSLALKFRGPLNDAEATRLQNFASQALNAK